MELEDLVAYLRTKHHPKAILLHGSRARGDAFEESDYDFALITQQPDLARPEFYNGCALDVSGVSPTEKILMSGQTPTWPCLVLFDDADCLGEHLANQTHEAFEKGPLPLTREELENRCNFSKRLLQRIQGRGADPLVRFYYMGDFYQRFLRYWCELNQEWTMSVHLLLPRIVAEDSVFYQHLKDLWTEDYQSAALKIHLHLFKEYPSKE